jgi:acyl phosphate:glycerol-3-phosphate acyltransferase
MKTGKDIRAIESGRTGGTNAMRAAGFWSRVAHGHNGYFEGRDSGMDRQGAVTRKHLLHVLAPVAAIIGHNYSIFVPERNEQGRIVRLRGGAGGAPAVGGAIGFMGTVHIHYFSPWALWFSSL